jgi:hypothetical protein
MIMAKFVIGERVWHIDNPTWRIWDRTINGTRYRFVIGPERTWVTKNPPAPINVDNKVHEWWHESGARGE